MPCSVSHETACPHTAHTRMHKKYSLILQTLAIPSIDFFPEIEYTIIW